MGRSKRFITMGETSFKILSEYETAERTTIQYTEGQTYGQGHYHTLIPRLPSTHIRLFNKTIAQMLSQNDSLEWVSD